MKEMILRAVRTFVQAAAGYIVAQSALAFSSLGEGASFSKGALAAIITASVASGIAAVMNLPGKAVTEKEVGKISDFGKTTSEAVPTDKADATSEAVPTDKGETELQTAEVKTEKITQFAAEDTEGNNYDE